MAKLRTLNIFGFFWIGIKTLKRIDGMDLWMLTEETLEI